MIQKRHLKHSLSREEAGFTLVELLVVILIIGVLAAIAIPAFMNQRQRANTAALESDLRNVATAYQSWRANPANDNEKFWSYAGPSSGDRSIYIEHPEAVNNASDTRPRWHNITDLPTVPVSPGTVIELVVNRSVTQVWTRIHEEGEFCLVGAMRNSNWDFIPFGGMGTEGYARALYFDSKLGGIKTMDELVEAHLAGADMSCLGHPGAYIDAGYHE